MASVIVSSRRGFLTRLISFVAAPAIVRASSLMPVKALPRMLTHEETMALLCQNLYGELSEVTRKAFVPRLFAQIYMRAPLGGVDLERLVT